MYSVQWLHVNVWRAVTACQCIACSDCMSMYGVQWLHANVWRAVTTCQCMACSDWMPMYGVQWLHANVWRAVTGCRSCRGSTDVLWPSPLRPRPRNRPSSGFYWPPRIQTRDVPHLGCTFPCYRCPRCRAMYLQDILSCRYKSIIFHIFFIRGIIVFFFFILSIYLCYIVLQRV